MKPEGGRRLFDPPLWDARGRHRRSTFLTTATPTSAMQCADTAFTNRLSTAANAYRIVIDQTMTAQ
jgi:hypothetical protein